MKAGHPSMADPGVMMRFGSFVFPKQGYADSQRFSIF